MGHALVRRERRAHAVQRRADIERGDRRCERVRAIVQEGAPHLTERREVATVCEHESSVAYTRHAVGGVARDRHADASRRGALRDVVGVGIIRVVHEQVALHLVLRDARLRREVAVERAVPVEVIRGDRHQDRDPWRERLRELQLERRDLGDDHIVVLVDRVDQRRPDVAGRARTHPGAGEHRRDHRGDCRLAVRAGHRDDRHRSSLGREVDLAPYRDAAGAGCDDQRMLRADERARHDEIDAGDQRRNRGVVGTFHERRVERSYRDCPIAITLTGRRRILGDGHVPAFGAQTASHRHAGFGEPDHERAHHAFTAITRARTARSRRRRCLCRTRHRCRRTTRTAR